MKKVLIVFALLFNFIHSEAQISLGAKVHSGVAYIRSKNLKDGMKDDQFLTSGNTRSSLKAGFGLGGFAEYKIKDKLFVSAEPTINFFNSKIYTNRVYENLDSTGSGSVLRISSEATVKLRFINLPIMARYVVHPIKKYYVTGGLATNIAFKPNIKSEELVVSTTNKNGIIVDSDPVNTTVTGRAKKYKTFQFDLVIGAGRNFGRYGKDFMVDIRYYYPLSKSELYTNSNKFNDSTMNNRVFSKEGSSDFSRITGNKLNDYKMGMIVVSIRKSIYKR